jgi:hypothetical protein
MENPKTDVIFTAEERKAAREHSFLNKAEILNSELCGCYLCLKIFKADAITGWIEDQHIDTEQNFTAICPFCYVDSVIGSASGYPITLEYLKALDGTNNDEPLIKASSLKQLYDEKHPK